MSTIESILSRMMQESEFAEAVFADAEKALAEYDLPADEIKLFQESFRADFEALAAASPEERKSMVVGNYFDGRLLTDRDLTRDQG
jgi:hypothetical protein